MENRRIQHSTEHQRETRAQYQRNRRQRMNSEQRERELLRRRENYNQKKKGKQVEASANSVASTMPFQNLTNMNFTTTRFQRNHDFEAGPNVTHINDIALG
jgi:hypothetical protein